MIPPTGVGVGMMTCGEGVKRTGGVTMTGVHPIGTAEIGMAATKSDQTTGLEAATEAGVTSQTDVAHQISASQIADTPTLVHRHLLCLCFGWHRNALGSPRSSMHSCQSQASAKGGFC